MPVFAYRALTASGRAERGVLDADSLRGAWQRLRARGIYPTELLPAGVAIATRGVGAADRAAVMRQLASLVAAGVPVADALEAVAEETATDALGHALTVARARLREGVSLADALAASPGVFPPLHRELVRAGEAGGALALVLERLAIETEASASRRARLRAALAYPTIMITATTLVLAFLLVWVVPQVTRLFAETRTPLPLPTRALLAAAALARHTWWAWIGAVATALVAIRAWRATSAGRAAQDGLVLRIPVVGRVVRTAAVARVARTLSTVLGGGVPLDVGLGMAAAGAGNARVASAVAEAREAVRRGEPLAPALGRHGLFPPTMLRLVATGERTGALAAAFTHAAEAHEAQVERALAAAVALVEPALVIVMGAAVLALVLGILVPLLGLGPLGNLS